MGGSSKGKRRSEERDSHTNLWPNSVLFSKREREREEEKNFSIHCLSSGYSGEDAQASSSSEEKGKNRTFCLDRGKLANLSSPFSDPLHLPLQKEEEEKEEKRNILKFFSPVFPASTLNQPSLLLLLLLLGNFLRSWPTANVWAS